LGYPEFALGQALVNRGASKSDERSVVYYIVGSDVHPTASTGKKEKKNNVEIYESNTWASRVWALIV